MNKLEHLAEFEALLSDYRVSEDSKRMLTDARLVTCSGATSTGRNTIFKELLKTGKYYFVVSDTTREPRKNNGVLEQNGTEYWFKTEDEMLEAIREGKMIEAEIIHEQQVSGMSVREIMQAKKQNKIGISDVDRGGVRIVKQAKPNTMCLFFLPPNFTEWQRRIADRGKMDGPEYLRRMKTAIAEFSEALEKPYYWFVVNDDLQDAVDYCYTITQAGKPDEHNQMSGRMLVEQLLRETKKFLASHTL